MIKKFDRIVDISDRLNTSPGFWAVLMIASTLTAAISYNVMLWVLTVVSAHQLGVKATVREYERGIICADCGDHIDSEDLPKDPGGKHGLAA